MLENVSSEKAGRIADAAKAASALEEAHKEISVAHQESEKLRTTLEDTSASLDGARAELTAMTDSLREARLLNQKLEGELQLKTKEADESSFKVKNLTEQLGEAQKYAASLQQYNERVQGELISAQELATKAQDDRVSQAEEAAALRGKVAALEEQIGLAQASGTNSEAARGNAIEEAARLRAELSIANADKIQAASEAARLKADLEECRVNLARYREATGQDLVALEAEKAGKAILESRTKAQAEINANLVDQAALLREQRDLAEARADKSSAELASLKKRTLELEIELGKTIARLHEGESLRRKLHNTIQELRGNIRVFCRVRPAAAEETAEGPNGEPLVQMPQLIDQDAGCALDLFQPAKTATDREQRHHFTFDRVFGPTAPQEEVFEELSHLVQSALDGYKVCCFAYGQTGSGKTHTMLGVPESPGLIPRAMGQVFETAQSMAARAGWRWDMKAAMLEVYNEEIHDLLGSGPPVGKKHAISHDEKGNTTVSHLQWVDVGHADSVASLLSTAMDKRAVGATAMNNYSSRSHFVFSLALEGVDRSSKQKVKGLLHMVDLAGSERLDRSQVAGDRLKETQAINKSLSALGDVISSLANKEPHVPYRNSKLTYFLQHSLSGSGKALMVVNVSPALENLPETVCSLRFAAKVNACEIGTAKRQVLTSSK